MAALYSNHLATYLITDFRKFICLVLPMNHTKHISFVQNKGGYPINLSPENVCAFTIAIFDLIASAATHAEQT